MIEKVSYLKQSSHWDEEKIQLAYARLRPHIDEYKYLAAITDWQLIRDRPEIYIKLQEAYDIMVLNEIKDRFRRCKPCERMALCAIQDLTNSGDGAPMSFKGEKEEWELDELVAKLNIPKGLKESCEQRHKDKLDRHHEYIQKVRAK